MAKAANTADATAGQIKLLTSTRRLANITQPYESFPLGDLKYYGYQHQPRQ